MCGKPLNPQMAAWSWKPQVPNPSKRLVRFNPSQWIAHTSGLSAAEMGAFIMLLSAAALQQDRTIPDDAKLCARLCGGMTKAQWLKVRASLILSGQLTETSNGTLTIPLLEQWERQPLRESIPPSIRLRVFLRDDYRCVYCGTDEEPLHLDHVHPVSRGGGNDLDNLVVACRRCNLSKGARSVEEWLQ